MTGQQSIPGYRGGAYVGSQRTLSKKNAYLYAERDPIRINYDTVPSVEEWRAMVAPELPAPTGEYAAPAPGEYVPPPPPLPGQYSASSGGDPASATGEYIPPPPPLYDYDTSYVDPTILMRNKQKNEAQITKENAGTREIGTKKEGEVETSETESKKAESTPLEQQVKYNFDYESKLTEEDLVCPKIVIKCSLEAGRLCP